jgi:hypothetical protein
LALDRRHLPLTVDEMEIGRISCCERYLVVVVVYYCSRKSRSLFLMVFSVVAVRGRLLGILGASRTMPARR